jgi:Arc/MetJ-type ribon-helix-helix transcriptional regulator
MALTRRGPGSNFPGPDAEDAMKTLKIELPDQLAKQIADLVETGWFVNEEEIARLALAEFVHRHRFELEEQFQLEDIHWALSLKGAGR